MFTDVGAEDTVAWTHEFDYEVKSIVSGPEGRLLVRSANYLYCLNKAKGELIWKSGALAAVDPVPVPDKPVILLCDRRIRAIDSHTGEFLWTSKDVGPYAAAGQFYLPEMGGLLMCVEGRSTRWMLLVDVVTGELIWENRDFFKDRKPAMFRDQYDRYVINGNQPPLFDSDTTFLTFMTKNHLRKWDWRTGGLLWETKLDSKEAPAPAVGYARMVLSHDGQSVYVPCKKRVWAVSTADGSILWDKPPDLKSVAMQVEEVPQGVLVRGGRQEKAVAQRPMITLLDRSSGRKVWNRDFLDLAERRSSPFVVHGDRALIWSENQLLSISLQTGAAETIVKVDFKASETPDLIVANDSGLLLASQQNAALVSYDGDVLFHTYHRGPGPSGLERFVYALFNAGRPRFAGQAESYFTKEFGNTQYASDFVYMTIKKTGPEQSTIRTGYPGTNSRRRRIGPKPRPGIVKVDLRTGETVGELPLDDEEPIYAIDPARSILFYAAKDDDDDLNRRVVRAYRL